MIQGTENWLCWGYFQPYFPVSYTIEINKKIKNKQKTSTFIELFVIDPQPKTKIIAKFAINAHLEQKTPNNVTCQG